MDNRGKPLPKFGEWDVNNPSSAEGFTVIFNKARDEKKTKKSPATIMAPQTDDVVYNEPEPYQHPTKRKWLCCGC